MPAPSIAMPAPTLEEVAAFLARLVEAGQPIGFTVEAHGVLAMLTVSRLDSATMTARAHKNEMERMIAEEDFATDQPEQPASPVPGPASSGTSSPDLHKVILGFLCDEAQAVSGRAVRHFSECHPVGHPGCHGRAAAGRQSPL